MPRLTRALQHRNYRLFAAGQLVSLTGTWMQSVAQAWLVYRLTESPVLLGLVTFTAQLPVFLIASIGGALADRLDKRRIIVCTQTVAMLQALTLAGLTLSGYVEVWHVFVLAAVQGLVYAFDIPTRQSFVVDMVGREDLMNAIALNSSMVNGARIIGPAIAGIIVAAVGEGWCFFINGISYIGVLSSLARMRLTKAPAIAREWTPIKDVGEGFLFVRRTAPIRGLLLLLAVMSLTAMPYTVLMPIFADQILHGGPRGLGVLMGAIGVGALCGALSIAARRGVDGLDRWVALASMGFGGALVLFSLSRQFWLSVALLVPAGMMMMVQMAASNTLIQAMVPDRLRGRVMAIYSMMFMGMAPFGALSAGAIAGWIGAPRTVALGGLACAAAAAIFLVRLPATRGETQALILAEGRHGLGS